MDYNLKERAVIWLDIFDFLTYHKKKEILELYNQPSEIFENFKENFSRLSHIIDKEQFDKMSYANNQEFISSHILNMERSGISVITCYSADYPEIFKNIPDSPMILYAKGDRSLLKTVNIGVVGTRKVSRYGAGVTEKIVKELVANGITIVSGMAEGVDTIAHQTALRNGGKTIAVLGSGFDEIYPHSNLALSKQIEKSGLLISEYPPHSKPAAYHFPVRNRIIALLSRAVVITEAGIKSGVMHTKNYCAEYGIDMFAVPGNIDNFSSAGCNLILKSCQASLITSGGDVLEHLRITNVCKGVKKQRNLQLTMEEQQILNILKDDELHFDEILNKTKVDTKVLVRLLTTLELNGIIKKSAGNYYSQIKD